MEPEKCLLTESQRANFYTEEMLSSIDRCVERLNNNINIEAFAKIRKAASEMLGEENVDIPDKVTRLHFQELYETSFNLGVLYCAPNGLTRDLIKKQRAQIESFMQMAVEIPIHFRFPKIVYTNSLNEELLLQDVYVRMFLHTSGKSLSQCWDYFQIARSTFEKDGIFTHSHAGKYGSHASRFLGACLGVSEFAHLMMHCLNSNRLSENIVLFKKLIASMKAYVSFENIEEGAPYHNIPEVNEYINRHYQVTPIKQPEVSFQETEAFAKKLIQKILQEYPEEFKSAISSLCNLSAIPFRFNRDTFKATFVKKIFVEAGKSLEGSEKFIFPGKKITPLYQEEVLGDFLTFRGEKVPLKISPRSFENQPNILHENLQNYLVLAIKKALLKSYGKKQKTEAPSKILGGKSGISSL